MTKLFRNGALARLDLGRILIGLVLVLALLFAYDISRVRTDNDQAAADAPFQVVAAGNAISAPGFTLPTAHGGSVRLASATANGPVVLDFWATWCGPCNMELPLLDRVSKEYKARGVQFYGIDSDSTAAQIRRFFRNEQVGFPMLVDNGTVAQAYSVYNIPHVVVIDRNGLVRAQDIGLDPNTTQDLSSCLDKLLKEQ